MRSYIGHKLRKEGLQCTNKITWRW